MQHVETQAIAKLAAAAERLNGETSPGALLKAACRELTGLVDASACTLSRLQGEILIEVSGHWPSQERGPLADYSYLVTDYPLTKLVLESRAPRAVALDDESTDPGEAFVLRELGMNAVLLVPIVVQRRTWGLVEVYHPAPRRFSEDDARLATLLTTHVAGLLAQFEHSASTERLYREMLASLTTALEAKDADAIAHAQDVVDLALEVGSQLGLAPGDLKALEFAALLHDLGKIRIPESILEKPGPLTPEEWHVVRQHPAAGAQILAPIAALRPVGPIVRASHERWDGRGYPEGLAAGAIPLTARILFPCHAFHAMTQRRPYRRALTREEAIAELESNAGRQFDPECARILVGILRARDGAEHVRLHRPA